MSPAGSQRTDAEMVAALIRDRLATEPRTARAIMTDPMFAAAVTWMRTTLEAVVSYARMDGWSDTETAAVVRGALGRLLNDDSIHLAEEQIARERQW